MDRAQKIGNAIRALVLHIIVCAIVCTLCAILTTVFSMTTGVPLDVEELEEALAVGTLIGSLVALVSWSFKTLCSIYRGEWCKSDQPKHKSI